MAIQPWSQFEFIAFEEKVLGLPKQGFASKRVKMTKCWITGSGGLGKMPTTNFVLKKMPAPHGDLVDWFFFFLTMSSYFSESASGISYGAAK